MASRYPLRFLQAILKTQKPWLPRLIKDFRADAIRSIPVFNGMHRFLPTLLRMEGATVRQVPVRHTSRMAGRSKYGTLDRAFRGLRDALGVRWMQDRRFRWKIR